jgi:predicted metalloprotease with PDZ domain
MSKHLWLYEGITEYFANLIKYKGGVYTPDEYLRTMEGKLAEGQKFPAQEMSFTEMSAHVLEEKYHKHYGQVYQRGAILGMLLDAEIQRLTQGKKSLIDVVLTLNARYGAKKSFDEDSFIKEFVAEVHPDLKGFFDLYIEGKNQWKPNDQLNYIGIVYHDTLKENAMLNPLSKTDNDIEVRPIGVGLEQMVMKTGPAEWAGFKQGDIVNVNDYRDAFRPNNQDLKEGETAKLKVKRDKAYITLEIKVKYGLKTKTNALRWK